MMGLSLYSTVAVIAFAFVAVIGVMTKIILRAKRKKFDGVWSVNTEQRPIIREAGADDGWERL